MFPVLLFIRKTAALVLLLGASAAFAQTTPKISLWVPPFEHDGAGSTYDKTIQEYHSQVVRALFQHGQFTVVERTRNQVVEAERELQKSESFMDGKTVEQGKATGAEFLVSGHLEVQTGRLSLKITDVATGLLVEEQPCELHANLRYGDNNVATSPSWKKINRAVQELLNRWLLKDKMALVRVLETKNDKVRKVLLAGGSAKGLKKDLDLEIFYIETETVDGEALDRYVVVGKVRIDLVENANFSTAKVRDGDETIGQYLGAGKKLYGRRLSGQ